MWILLHPTVLDSTKRKHSNKQEMKDRILWVLLWLVCVLRDRIGWEERGTGSLLALTSGANCRFCKWPPLLGSHCPVFYNILRKLFYSKAPEGKLGDNKKRAEIRLIFRRCFFPIKLSAALRVPKSRASIKLFPGFSITLETKFPQEVNDG